MATTQIGLHPTVAIVPLISQSLTVFYAIVEPTIFIPFLKAADSEPDRAATQRITRLWWTHFLNYGLATIFSITLPAIVTSVWAARQLPSDSLEWKLYTAGACFGAGHFLAVPFMSKIIDDLCDEQVEKKGQTMETLRKWLRVHYVRTLLADVPSWLCFAYLVFGL
jgi:hypothetical protein